MTVIGAGYVGLASAFAAAHIGHRVTVLDKDERRIRLLQAGVDPLDEPLFASCLDSKTTFTMDARAACVGADVIVIAVGTPLLADGRADLSAVLDVAETIAAYAPRSTVLIRSTVAVGTADRLQRAPLSQAQVVSNPEFLREGSALADALRPERIVAGGPSSALAVVERLYGPILDQNFFPLGDLRPAEEPVQLCWMDRQSAELTKYAANAFLATKLSYVNEIANIAKAVGADIRAITHALGLDRRIAPGYLRPGIGWGGACFPKDIRALAALADDAGYEFTILRAVIDQNNRQLLRFFSMIEAEFRDQSDVRIGLLGLAFKSETADCRESPAIALAKLLLWQGRTVVAYDPAVSVRTPEIPAGVVLAQDIDEAATGADALVVATEWPEFAEANFLRLRNVMRGKTLFDGRCIVDPDRCTAAGLRYIGICAPARASESGAVDERTTQAFELADLTGAVLESAE